MFFTKENVSCYYFNVMEKKIGAEWVWITVKMLQASVPDFCKVLSQSSQVLMCLYFFEEELA